EMHQTNMLEGVRSSRREMVKSAKQLSLFPDDEVRFKSMIHAYKQLLTGETRKIKHANQIREIYDDLVADEMDTDHLPDGEIFRRDETEVLQKSGSGKVIHKGIYPEEKITNAINQLLAFLNNENDIPFLMR